MRHNGLRYPWWVRCLMSSRNVEWQSRDRMCDTQLQCQFPALIGPRRKDQGEFHGIPHSFRNRRDHCRPEDAYAEDTPSVASDELLGWMAPTARDCDWGCIGCPVVGLRASFSTVLRVPVARSLKLLAFLTDLSTDGADGIGRDYSLCCDHAILRPRRGIVTKGG